LHFTKDMHPNTQTTTTCFDNANIANIDVANVVAAHWIFAARFA